MGRSFTADAWLAGFIDGEGCFIHNNGRRATPGPRFSIGLRWDDEPLLRAELGGSISSAHQLRGKKREQFELWCRRFGFREEVAV